MAEILSERAAQRDARSRAGQEGPVRPATASPFPDQRPWRTQGEAAANLDCRYLTSAGLTCPRSTNWSRRRIKNDELPKSLRKLRARAAVFLGLW